MSKTRAVGLAMIALWIVAFVVGGSLCAGDGQARHPLLALLFGFVLMPWLSYLMAKAAYKDKEEYETKRNRK
jgi:multisubunit Na+/H+ antiporter MnhG subunit